MVQSNGVNLVKSNVVSLVQPNGVNLDKSNGVNLVKSTGANLVKSNGVNSSLWVKLSKVSSTMSFRLPGVSLRYLAWSWGVCILRPWPAKQMAAVMAAAAAAAVVVLAVTVAATAAAAVATAAVSQHCEANREPNRLSPAVGQEEAEAALCWSVRKAHGKTGIT